jgi:NAD-dependent malate dehydrogenase
MQTVLSNVRKNYPAIASGVIGAVVGGASWAYYTKKVRAATNTAPVTQQPIETPKLKTDVTQAPQGAKKTLRVAVTGAAGQIAYSFLPMLASGQVFGPDVKIEMRLLDIAPAETILKAVKMELEDGAYSLVQDIESGTDPKIVFKDCDVVVFIGGFPRKEGMERKDLLTTNGVIFSGQGAALSEVAKKDVKCLVVANPANTNCLILQEHAKGIPKENFSCLTRLDHNRAVSQIALRAKTAVDDVKNVIIWGNHSATQYPDVNHATVNGELVRQYIKDDAWLNSDFITTIQKRGAAVISLRKTSSAFSAANATKDHLKDWYLGTAPGEWVSMGIVSDGNHYNIPAGLVYSFPVTIKPNFHHQVVKSLKIDEFSKEKMNITLKELQEEKELALGK